MILPTEKHKVEQYNPSLLILYGKAKAGKSTLMASLEDNLIIDLDDGYKSLEAMSILARTPETLFEIKKALVEKAKDNPEKPVYKFITIDNATRLEEMSVKYANYLYRNTSFGSTWGLLKDPKNPASNLKDANGNFIPDPKADVRLLPNGAGWTYIRKAVKELIFMFKPFCETLILIAHSKDKQIRLEGTELSEMSVDLAGKLADIICGEADAIGWVYRQGNTTYVSFEGGDSINKEARPLHLRGKKFAVITSDADNNLTIDTSKIFL